MVKIIMSVIKRGMPDSRDISEIELLGFGNMMTNEFPVEGDKTDDCKASRQA